MSKLRVNHSKCREFVVQVVVLSVAVTVACASTPQYCMWRCGFNVCCPGGERTQDFFPVIADSTAAVGDDDATLVVSATWDRADNFKKAARAWPGPKVLVVAIFNYSAADYESAAHELAQLRVFAAELSNTLTRVAFITARRVPGSDIDVEPPDAYTQFLQDKRASPEMLRHVNFPVNTLRNLAMDLAKTNWVFPLDADFVPTTTLYPMLVSTYLPKLKAFHSPAVIIPAFSIGAKVKDRHFAPPSNFSEMETLVRANTITPFKMPASVMTDPYTAKFNATWAPKPANPGRPGLSASYFFTDYAKWYRYSRQGSGVGIVPIVVPPTTWFEPFVLIRRVGPSGHRPRYDENFCYRYRNKIDFWSVLATHGYHPYVLLSELVLHLDHPPRAKSHPQLTPEQLQRDAKARKAFRKLMWMTHNRLVKDRNKNSHKFARNLTQIERDGWLYDNDQKGVGIVGGIVGG
eukprot:m.64228 g.64228  ORF g.64228 m.64228 type:complete len:462 (-) comp9706_c0_seq1:3263-4648(-)